MSDPLLPDGALINQDVGCPECGYNLRGLRDCRCPECGAPFDPAKLVTSHLPWAHRRRLGRLRAYWQTVRIATANARALGRELDHPQNYRDAQLFRWITIAHAQAASLLVSLALPGRDLGYTAIAEISTLVLLIVLTGLPSYFFHPKYLAVEHQNRAICLSYYCCAPLAWELALLIPAWLLHRLAGPLTVWRFLVIASVGLFVLWWRALVLLARQISQGNRTRVLWTAIMVPLLWLLVGGLAYPVTAWVLRFLGIVYFSLQD